MGNPLTAEERKRTPVGRGINLLSDAKLSLSNTSCEVMDTSKLSIDCASDYGGTDSDVETRSTKHELAQSISQNIKAGFSLFKISASVKRGFSSETASSTEMTYSAAIAILKREIHALDTEGKSAEALCRDILRPAMRPAFANDLNGKMAPDRLFATYGTHVILRGGLGGFASAFFTTEKRTNKTIEETNTELKDSLGSYLEGEYTSSNKFTASSMIAHGRFSADSEGGYGLNANSAEAFLNSYTEWAKSLDTDPTSRQFCYFPTMSSPALLPIWMLAADKSRRAELRNAYGQRLGALKSPLLGLDYYLDEISVNCSRTEADVRRNLNSRAGEEPWHLIDQDLSKGTGGSYYIYMNYRMNPGSKCNAEGPIRHIVLLHKMCLSYFDGIPMPKFNKALFSVRCLLAQKKYGVDSFDALSYEQIKGIMNEGGCDLSSCYPDWAIRHADYVRQVYKALEKGVEGIAYMPDEYGEVCKYHVIPVDLNKGVKGRSYIYLCYTRDPKCSHPPITALNTYLDNEYPASDWNTACWAGTSQVADLSYGSAKHKNGLHLIFQHAKSSADQLTGRDLLDLDALIVEEPKESDDTGTPAGDNSRPTRPAGNSRPAARPAANEGSSEPQYISTLVFSGARYRSGDGHWESGSAKYSIGNTRPKEFQYHMLFVTESGLMKYRGSLITNLMLLKTDAAPTWTSLMIKDKNGISAKYYPIKENLNLSGSGKQYYLCYTYDGQYTPLTKFAVLTKEQMNAYRRTRSEAVRVAGTGEIADLLDGTDSGLYLCVQRAASFDWKNYGR